MNNTVTLSLAIERMAEITGTDTATSRRFLRHFFNLIEESLVEGESVVIKNIGTFSLGPDSDGNNTKVLFLPDPVIAKEINTPFAMFEAVELADDISESDFLNDDVPETDTTTEPRQEMQIGTETTDHQITESQTETETLPSTGPETEIEPETEPVHTENLRYADETVDDTQPEASQESTVVQDTYSCRTESKHHIPAILWVLIGVFIGIIFGFIGGKLYYERAIALANTRAEIEQVQSEIDSNFGDEEYNNQTESDNERETQLTVATDTTESVVAATEQAKPAETPKTDEPVYEVVSKKRYLAKMARDHYGNLEYWPYIYKANESKLGHPDRIPVGTKVLIPQYSEYATHGNDSAANLRDAKRMGAEIYKKYK